MRTTIRAVVARGAVRATAIGADALTGYVALAARTHDRPELQHLSTRVGEVRFLHGDIAGWQLP